MSGSLSSADLAHLEGALRVVLAPTELGDPRAWGDALCASLAPLVPGGMASLLRVTPAGPYTHTGLPLEDQVAYVRHYARLDVAASHQTARRLEVAHRWSLVSREACRRTEFYEEFLRPRRLEDAYWLNTFGADGALRHRVFLNFRRELSDPERERVTTVLRLLAPAFRAGTTMLDRFGCGAAPLLRAVDALPQAIQLLDLRGRVVHRNPVLARLLAADPERDRVEGALVSAALGAAAVARGRSALRRGDAPVPADLAVPTRAGGYAVRASLLAGDDAGSAEPLVLVEVERRGGGAPAAGGAVAAPAAGDDALRARWGLTAQECAVARLLAERLSDAEIAARLGVSPHTARTHVERVRRKLRVRRRTEVGVALAGPAAPAPNR